MSSSTASRSSPPSSPGSSAWRCWGRPRTGWPSCRFPTEDVQYGTRHWARPASCEDLPYIKPADDKCFPAAVYTSGDRLPGADVLPDATPVLIAEVVRWEVEYRCFVLGRAVTAWSPYLRAGELCQAENGIWPAPPAESAEALAFTAGVLTDAAVALPPAVVLDVGKIAGRGWAVVEANAAWGSGIYGCDPAHVLAVVRRSCVSRVELAEQDKPWVLEPGARVGP